MKLQNQVWVFVLLLLSISFTQAMDGKDAEEQIEIVQKHMTDGKLNSSESGMEMLSQLPDLVFSEIILSKLVLAQCEIDGIDQFEGVTKVEAKEQLDSYYQTLFEDFCKRVPGQSKASFDEAMRPFEDYFRALIAKKVKISTWNDEENTTQLSVVTKLLQAALKM
jgi:hypothetical protein